MWMIIELVQNSIITIQMVNQTETKILIMEGYGMNEQSMNRMNFFVLLQDKMEELMNFLIESEMISKAEEYQKFILKTRNYLKNYEF